MAEDAKTDKERMLLEVASKETMLNL